MDLPEDNVFAYEARRLAPERCIPADGSAAARAADGAMLLFEMPNEVYEYRNLRLEIRAPSSDAAVRIELDG
jgi:hypothetical protein